MDRGGDAARGHGGPAAGQGVRARPQAQAEPDAGGHAKPPRFPRAPGSGLALRGWGPDRDPERPFGRTRQAPGSVMPKKSAPKPPGSKPKLQDAGFKPFAGLKGMRESLP